MPVVDGLDISVDKGEVLAIVGEPGKGGEIQITDALLKQAKDGCVIADKFKGQRFDCGGAEGYIDATNFCFENFYKTGKAY